MLAECGVDYRLVPVDIMAGEQFRAAFLAISPNNKNPVLSDPDGPGGEPVHIF